MMPRFEVFHADEYNAGPLGGDELEPLADGWYWWLIRPDGLPDFEPEGPFGSKRAAHDDVVAYYRAQTNCGETP